MTQPDFLARLHAFLEERFLGKTSDGTMAMEVRRTVSSWLFREGFIKGESPIEDQFGPIPWEDLEPWVVPIERHVWDGDNRSEGYQDRSQLVVTFRRRRLMKIAVQP